MSEILKPTRRGLITGLASLIVAPAIIKVQNIMPVKAVELPLPLMNYGEYDMYDHMADAFRYGVHILYGSKRISLYELYLNVK